jgi:hypothetical protein
MNSRQRTILKALAVVIAGTLLFPPFHIRYGAGSIGLGYAFIFSRPDDRAGIDAVQLLVQWIGIALIGGIFFKLSESWQPGNGPARPSVLQSMKEGFRRSKTWGWILTGMVAVSIAMAIGGYIKPDKAGAQFGAGFLLFAFIYLWHFVRSWAGIEDRPDTARINWKRIGLAVGLVTIVIAGIGYFDRTDLGRRLLHGGLISDDVMRNQFGDLILRDESPTPKPDPTLTGGGGQRPLSDEEAFGKPKAPDPETDPSHMAQPWERDWSAKPKAPDPKTDPSLTGGRFVPFSELTSPQAPAVVFVPLRPADPPPR